MRDRTRLAQATVPVVTSRSVTYHAGMKRALSFLLVLAVAGAAVSAQQQSAKKRQPLCLSSFENL